jgi:hypothetical protein
MPVWVTTRRLLRDLAEAEAELVAQLETEPNRGDRIEIVELLRDIEQRRDALLTRH